MEENEKVTLSSLATATIETKIITLRGTQIILDRDLADLYEVDTKVLNQAVKRNIERFPDSFRFQLSLVEKNELVTNCDRFERLKHSTALPYAFTEQGVAMLASVLHSDTAIQVSIKIIEAFVAMRNYLLFNAQIFQHIEHIDRKLIENDQKFELIFSRFNEGVSFRQGIFFDGQTYDAYAFISNLIRTAKNRIVLIDNYVDDTVLTMLDKRDAGVTATIYTGQISRTLQLDIDRHNSQYTAIDIKVFQNSHDRFLIIDDKVYHFGASIKDLGKKWFAVSLMSELTVEEILLRLE